GDVFFARTGMRKSPNPLQPQPQNTYHREKTGNLTDLTNLTNPTNPTDPTDPTDPQSDYFDPRRL
ncbi:MAG: hypothetical protein PHF14_08630, partial [Verrucomicrobiota bacterium]|nr:hypothetical protein [Verrucomicrobiota bacterium]